MADLSNAGELVERFCFAYEADCPAPTLTLKTKLCLGSAHTVIGAWGVFQSESLEGHDYTRVECSVILRESKDSAMWKCTWRIQRRVSTIREDLHAVVKRALGDANYDELFHPDYPFLRQGGVNVPFNTWRLEAWLERLGEIISQRKLNPTDVRVILSNLVNPSFSQDEFAAFGEKKPWCIDEKTLEEQLGQWNFCEDLYNQPPGPRKHPGSPPFAPPQRVPRQPASANGYGAAAAVLGKPSLTHDVPVNDPDSGADVSAGAPIEAGYLEEGQATGLPTFTGSPKQVATDLLAQRAGPAGDAA